MALKGFGKITVTTSNTPVRVTVHETTPSKRVGLQSISVFALAGNSGANIYLGSSTMNFSTFVGVYAIVPKGAVISSGIEQAPAGLNAADLYLCADTDGDSALVSGTEQ